MPPTRKWFDSSINNMTRLERAYILAHQKMEKTYKQACLEKNHCMMFEAQHYLHLKLKFKARLERLMPNSLVLHGFYLDYT